MKLKTLIFAVASSLAGTTQAAPILYSLGADNSGTYDLVSIDTSSGVVSKVADTILSTAHTFSMSTLNGTTFDLLRRGTSAYVGTIQKTGSVSLSAYTFRNRSLAGMERIGGARYITGGASDYSDKEEILFRNSPGAWDNNQDGDYLFKHNNRIYGVDVVNGGNDRIFDSITGAVRGSIRFSSTSGWAGAAGDIFGINNYLGRDTLVRVNEVNGVFSQTGAINLLGNYSRYQALAFNGEMTPPPPPAPTPAPAAALLFGMGMLAIGAIRRRRFE